MTRPDAASLARPRCEKDHAVWLDEIELWQRDHAGALETLEETARFIRRHDAELVDHLREIDAHRRHADSGDEPSPEVRRQHLEVRRRHNIFKGRHRALVDEVLRLRVALHKAAHGRVFSTD